MTTVLIYTNTRWEVISGHLDKLYDGTEDQLEDLGFRRSGWRRRSGTVEQLVEHYGDITDEIDDDIPLVPDIEFKPANYEQNQTVFDADPEDHYYRCVDYVHTLRHTYQGRHVFHYRTEKKNDPSPLSKQSLAGTGCVTHCYFRKNHFSTPRKLKRAFGVFWNWKDYAKRHGLPHYLYCNPFYNKPANAPKDYQHEIMAPEHWDSVCTFAKDSGCSWVDFWFKGREGTKDEAEQIVNRADELKIALS